MPFRKTNASVCCGLVHIGWILHCESCGAVRRRTPIMLIHPTPGARVWPAAMVVWGDAKATAPPSPNSASGGAALVQPRRARCHLARTFLRMRWQDAEQVGLRGLPVLLGWANLDRAAETRRRDPSSHLDRSIDVFGFEYEISSDGAPSIDEGSFRG